MSTFDYASLRDTADELIAQFGQSAGLKRKVDGGTATRACMVVEVDYRPSERDGQIVQFTDRRFLLAAGGQSIPPSSEDDQLIYEGKTFRIVTAKQIKPAEMSLVYDLQVRL